MGKSVTTWPPALPSAALHHLLWDYGIVFALRRDTAVAPGRGHSFYSCIIPSGGLIGGGYSSTVYTWLDPKKTRYGFGYGSPWSPAGLVHALEEDIVLAARLWGVPARGRSGRHHCPSGMGVVFIT
jgi:hypothetical protein